MKTAIAIVATGAYLEGARVFFHSLEKHGLPNSIDRIVLGTESCDFATSLPVTEDYLIAGITDQRCHETLKNFFPLLLASEQGYDRIISANADMLCIGDPSYLWSENIGQLPFYAVHDTAAQVYYPDSIARLGLNPLLIFNAGLYVYHPQRMPELHSRMLGEISRGNCQSYEVGDQGFWNHFFQQHNLEVGYLPTGLNYCLDQHFPKPLTADQRIIHFTGKKPWAWHPLDNHWTYPYYALWHKERGQL